MTGSSHGDGRHRSRRERPSQRTPELLSTRTWIMAIAVTTTHDIQGRRVAAYLGIVTGEAVMGTNFVSDWFAGIRDVFGGRSGSYQKLLNRAKDQAVE